MGVQVVHDQPDNCCIGIILIQQPLDLMGPVLFPPVLFGINIAVFTQRLVEHEDAAGAAPYVL